MPAKKKRIRPVIEEVTPEPTVSQLENQEPQEPEGKEPEETLNEPEQEPETAKEKTDAPNDAELAPEEEVELVQTEPEDMLKDKSLSVNHPAPPPGAPAHKGSSLKLMLFVTILTALVVGFIAGGVYVYYTGVSSLGKPIEKMEAEPTPIPEASPSPTPESTPAPEENVDVSSYDVSVLNGSGKIGEAGKVQDILEAAEFNVTNVGNASRYDFEETVIQVKEDTPEVVLNKLKEVLADTYEVEVGDTLPSNSNYEVVVTVGSKLTS